MVEPRLKAERILRELRYDFRSFTIEQFIRWIEALRRRQVLSTPWKMPAGMFGAWMVDEDLPRDYIFYRNDVPSLHQVHIQLHELAHLLFDHPTLRINREMIAGSLQDEVMLPFSDLVLLDQPRDQRSRPRQKRWPA